MAVTEVVVQVDGAAGRIDARTLVEVVRAVLDLLESVGGHQAGAARWVPGQLTQGSLCLELRSDQPGTEDDAATVMSGIEQLADSVTLPSGFDDRGLKAIVDMSRAAHRGGGQGVKVLFKDKKCEVTQTVGDHADAARKLRVALAWGSVTGVLDRLVLRHDKNEVGLIDEVGRRAVTVRFPPRLREEVISAMGRRVVCVGKLSRNLSGDKGLLELHEIFVDERRPPRPIGELVGVLGSEWTGGRNSVEFVRGNRRA